MCPNCAHTQQKFNVKKNIIKDERFRQTQKEDRSGAFLGEKLSQFAIPRPEKLLKRASRLGLHGTKP